MEHLYFNSVQEFNDHYGFETYHPLVSVVRFDRQDPFEECMVHYGIYALFLKENKGCKMFYGRILAKAKELLQSETLSVTQVSDSLGFEYPQHFVRFFKALTGMTPTQWRAA